MVVCSFIPILFLWLLPRRKEIFLVQQINEFLEQHHPKLREDDNDTKVPLNDAKLIEEILKLDPDYAKSMGVYDLFAE